ncbi:transmembrane [Cystoisospora suis]|uniref:Transmembrane n=1 Tax=Cystoisospora suis TaxID=483139 RepID=A0A2C6KR30_9APIC|nr:transmembrane [Cystoisospora suis]
MYSVYVVSGFPRISCLLPYMNRSIYAALGPCIVYLTSHSPRSSHKMATRLSLRRHSSSSYSLCRIPSSSSSLLHVPAPSSSSACSVSLARAPVVPEGRERSSSSSSDISRPTQELQQNALPIYLNLFSREESKEHQCHNSSTSSPNSMTPSGYISICYPRHQNPYFLHRSFNSRRGISSLVPPRLSSLCQSVSFRSLSLSSFFSSSSFLSSPSFCPISKSSYLRCFSSTPPPSKNDPNKADEENAPEKETGGHDASRLSSSSSSSSTLSPEVKSIIEFCHIASGMPVDSISSSSSSSSPSSSSSTGSRPESVGWTYTREDEKFVRSPGGFLGLVLAFNQKFARLRDLGIHINLSCREGSRQALRLLSFELTEGLDNQREAVAEFLSKTAKAEEKEKEKKHKEVLKKDKTEKEEELGIMKQQGEEKKDQVGEENTVLPTSSGDAMHTEKDANLREKRDNSKEEEDSRQTSSVSAEKGDQEDEKTKMLKKELTEGRDSDPSKKDENILTKEKASFQEELSRIARNGLLEDLRLCVAEPLFTGLQAKAAELIEQGCTVKFDLHEIQSVVINKLWTVCGVLPSSHGSALNPSSCSLVAIAPALHVVVPFSSAKSLSYPPPTEYIRTCHGPLSTSIGSGTGGDEESSEESGEEEEDGLEKPRSNSTKRSGSTKVKEEEGKTADQTSPGGAGQATNRRPGDMSFIERLQLGFERMELLTEAMTKGVAVVMEVKLLCTQTFEVFDRDNKLIWGSDGEEERVVHTLRFQLTARHDGTRQWGFPVFQPSPWMLTDWNGLVGSEYPCDVHIFRNVVLLEKNQEPPKGRRICYE